MGLISPAIRFFIGFCLFTLCHAEKQNIPDNGRLDVGKCFAETLDWKMTNTKELPDVLCTFCQKTEANMTHIQDEMKTKNLNPEEVFTKIKQCLENNSTQNLIQRYKDFALEGDMKKLIEAKDPPLPEINQVALGLCKDKEMIEFSKLNTEDKSKTSTCLQTCAEDLFRKFEHIFDDMNKVYKDLRAKGEIIFQPVNPEGDDDDDDAKSPTNPPSPTERQELPEEFLLGASVQEYIEDCKNAQNEAEKDDDKFLDISDLNTLGERYAKFYLQDIFTLYQLCSIAEEKKQLFASVESYFACVKWSCAIKKIPDVPMQETLSQVMERRSKNKDEIVND